MFSLLPIQLLATTPGKTMEDGLSACVPAIHPFLAAASVWLRLCCSHWRHKPMNWKYLCLSISHSLWPCLWNKSISKNMTFIITYFKGREAEINRKRFSHVLICSEYLQQPGLGQVKARILELNLGFLLGSCHSRAWAIACTLAGSWSSNQSWDLNPAIPIWHSYMTS